VTDVEFELVEVLELEEVLEEVELFVMGLFVASLIGCLFGVDVLLLFVAFKFSLPSLGPKT
jgi:hypothetical protein